MTMILTELDLLAPLEIWEVALEHGGCVKFHRPLVLQPEWMPEEPEEPEDEKYLLIEYPDLGISAWGHTRKELWISVRDDIRFCWKHYAAAQDAQLAPDAKTIKDNYLAAAEVIDG